MQENLLLSETVEAEKMIEIKDLSLDVVVTEMNIGTLVTNAKEVLASIRKIAPQYKAENYSEDNLKQAEADRAVFNKLAKGAVETRTAKRTEFLVPFMPYSDTVDEIVAETKSVSDIINVVIKDVEKREKDKKGNEISEFFDGLKIATFTLQQIWNPAWLNKGSKIKDIQNEIIAQNAKVNAELLELDALGEPEAKASYLETLDIVAAKKDAARIKENRARLERLEADRKAEADRVEAKRIEDEKARLAQIQSAPVQETVIAPIVAEQVYSHRTSYTEPKTEPVITVTASAVIEPEVLERSMKVWGTMDQIVALGDFMNANGIVFEKI